MLDHKIVKATPQYRIVKFKGTPKENILMVNAFSEYKEKNQFPCFESIGTKNNYTYVRFGHFFKTQKGLTKSIANDFKVLKKEALDPSQSPADVAQFADMDLTDLRHTTVTDKQTLDKLNGRDKGIKPESD